MLVARVRAVAGRVATVAGSAVLTGGLLTDSVTVPGVFAAAAAGVGLATNAKILRAPDAAKGTAIAVYAAPHAGVAAILIGERLAPNGAVSVLVQAGIVALWTGATWWVRPGHLARELVDESVDQEITEANEGDTDAAAEVAVPEQPAYASPAARWWAEEIAVEDGIAPGTVLLEHQQVDDNCVAVVFGSGKRGTPATVADNATARLSANLEVPEELIEIGPVPGRGAGVRLLVVGQRPKPPEEEEKKTSGSDEEVWAEIAATAMPGVELVEANTYEMRKELT
jgi:hypothetical protein